MASENDENAIEESSLSQSTRPLMISIVIGIVLFALIAYAFICMHRLQQQIDGIDNTANRQMNQLTQQLQKTQATQQQTNEQLQALTKQYASIDNPTLYNIRQLVYLANLALQWENNEAKGLHLLQLAAEQLPQTASSTDLQRLLKTAMVQLQKEPQADIPSLFKQLQALSQQLPEALASEKTNGNAEKNRLRELITIRKNTSSTALSLSASREVPLLLEQAKLALLLGDTSVYQQVLVATQDRLKSHHQMSPSAKFFTQIDALRAANITATSVDLLPLLDQLDAQLAPTTSTYFQGKNTS